MKNTLLRIARDYDAIAKILEFNRGRGDQQSRLHGLVDRNVSERNQSVHRFSP
jgi:hypothetical protein